MGVKGKVKRLGGIKREVGEAVVTLDAKKEIGRRILAGDVTVATVAREYGVTPQAVGWWKRLAEREDAGKVSEKDLPPWGQQDAPKMIELLDELAVADVDQEPQDVIVHTSVEGACTVVVYVGEHPVYEFEGLDLHIRRNVTGGFSSANWTEASV
jgi:transposase-like protein